MELMSNKMRNLVNVRAWPVIKQWQISPEKVNEGAHFCAGGIFFRSRNFATHAATF